MSTILTTSLSPSPAPVLTPVQPSAARAVPRKAILAGAAGLALFALLPLGYRHVLFAFSHETTDNAQIEGHISPVLPRVPGYVARVLVTDNQRVSAGQPLVELDPADLSLKIANAEAAAESARAALQVAAAALENVRAAEAVAKSNVATATVAQTKAASDLARDAQLIQTGAISDRQWTDSRAAADSTAAQLETARRQGEAAVAQVKVAEAQIAVARAQAGERTTDVDYAKLQRSYTIITAPIAGQVSRKNVEPGQFVQAGQTLLSISADEGLWLVANYKETQVARMHEGQSVVFTVDGYPGLEFHGIVDSLAGTTGARFALLPPDNATGNFVKVTQRIPVKIALTGTSDSQRILRPGMSVDTTVRVKD
jgi:membrane fusion protein, multidrug efflux system